MIKLEAQSLTKDFGSVRALDDISFTVAEREFVVLVGPSGCGKSTLLRLIAGLEEISNGKLIIEGSRVNDVPASQRGLAMVFQSYALYPHMTVEENMSVGLRIAGKPKDEIRQKVKTAAQILQLDELLARKPKQLSGGQRQRVAIGRAIVRDPTVFLFDEPLSNLDAALRLQMRLEIAKLHKQLNATMIYVTHDQVEAMTLADKIIVLNNGKIEQTGSPLELYRQPLNRFVAGFIGSPQMNFLDGRITAAGDKKATINLDCGLSVPLEDLDASLAGKRATLGIRPEHIVILSEERQTVAPACANVQVVEHLGSQTIIYANLEDGTALSIIDDETTEQCPGELIAIDVPSNAAYLFDENGIERLRSSRISERKK
ncbi:sn-glycerol-3-phosphate ABC transporter ATP-binding protein UgpC [uncultured Hoeflea sp.]|uniref:ABC transporter ATP-binding protein n=1 Tax=uncultured Hoeflea sp. TaxID=538666 RepID=UPI00260ED493|nr:sn-glycerol-3-phosphate ABC transporter ATP-binding protein UgpC [uncultured Hoeflea sp.]